MDQDISKVLQAWKYDPTANVRKIWGDDGIQKVQVRIDQGAFQGILQLNLDGRPDGKKPYGFDFALDYYRSALEKYRRVNKGDEKGFTLDGDACRELFDEGTRVYGRYAFLLQLQDYERVIRDTERNMALFRFVNTYGEEEEDRMNLEKWWPYIIRLNATARAMQSSQKGEFEGALEIVREAREKIDRLPEMESEEFHVERARSEESLDELEKELLSHKPPSRRERLQKDLQNAIDEEDFERAAAIRDELRGLKGPEPQEGR